ncbi:MAG TPA: hypothetical protein VM100_13965 [Longimicrobiales bacterium]|nr:hypothetical protein [Longimicrobiales bacterium]
MDKLSKHGSLFDFVTMIAVAAGVIYGAIEVRNLREAREREAMFRLFEIGESESYINALMFVRNLPDSLTRPQLDSAIKANEAAVRYIGTTWEGLGLLVYRRQVPLPSVDELYAGPILLSWNKLKPWIEDRRRTGNRQSFYEWFQWLAERLNEYEKDGERTPAYIAHKNWKWQK